MKRTLKSVAMLSTISLLAVTPILLSANTASAQIVGMNGSYLGGGIAAGVTDGDGQDTSFGGNVQGRFDVPLAPVSLRGSFLFNEDNTAVMPIVSYDIGVAPNTNLYAGVGYSFVGDEGEASPLGTQDAVVVTAGAETALQRNIVLYGDVKLGIDAYQNNDSAVSLQVGAAYRF